MFIISETFSCHFKQHSLPEESVLFLLLSSALHNESFGLSSECSFVLGPRPLKIGRFCLRLLGMFDVHFRTSSTKSELKPINSQTPPPIHEELFFSLFFWCSILPLVFNVSILFNSMSGNLILIREHPLPYFLLSKVHFEGRSGILFGLLSLWNEFAPV